MEHHYKIFNSDKRGFWLVYEKFNKDAFNPQYWYKEDGIKIYGVFHGSHSECGLFVYGRTIRPDDIIAAEKE